MRGQKTGAATHEPDRVVSDPAAVTNTPGTTFF